jgi:hypothetical protein
MKSFMQNENDVYGLKKKKKSKCGYLTTGEKQRLSKGSDLL